MGLPQLSFYPFDFLIFFFSRVFKFGSGIFFVDFTGISNLVVVVVVVVVVLIEKKEWVLCNYIIYAI